MSQTAWRWIITAVALLMGLGGVGTAVGGFQQHSVMWAANGTAFVLTSGIYLYLLWRPSSRRRP